MNVVCVCVCVCVHACMCMRIVCACLLCVCACVCECVHMHGHNILVHILNWFHIIVDTNLCVIYLHIKYWDNAFQRWNEYSSGGMNYP